MKEGGGGDSFFILFDDFDPKLIFILPYFFQKEWVKMIFFIKYTPLISLYFVERGWDMKYHLHLCNFLSIQEFFSL